MKKAPLALLLGLLVVAVWWMVSGRPTASVADVSRTSADAAAESRGGERHAATRREQLTHAVEPKWSKLANADTGVLHVAKRYPLPTSGRVADLLPALLAAAEKGDMEAATEAASYLVACAQAANAAVLAALMDYIIQTKQPVGQADRMVRLGNPVTRISVQGQSRDIKLEPVCEGLSAEDLKRAPALVERAAGSGNENAQVLYGLKWDHFAALRLELIGDTRTLVDSTRMPATARAPEVLAAQEAARTYLASAAQTGNVDAIQSLASGGLRDRAEREGPLGEDEYFWQQVLQRVAPERAEINAAIALAYEQSRRLPAAGNPSSLATISQDYVSRPEYFGIPPGRVAAIQAAAEAMARRCCQRRAG